MSLGAFLSAMVTLIIIQYFKPKIHICTPEIDEIDWYDDENTVTPLKRKVIKVCVKNLQKRKAAINLRTEICIVHGNFTYHFDLDRQDFIMLPKRWSNNDSSERTYIGYKTTEFTGRRTGLTNAEQLIDLLNENNAVIRVRIHASHEFTGFGRAFSAKFCLKNSLKFERLKENTLC
jgi:hypothetical protein